MHLARISLAAALGLLLLGPQAQAQFSRTGPRVTGAPTVVPKASPVPVVAPVTVSAPADKPPPPPAAKSEFPPVDAALPGGVLGLGDEGVGALVRPAEAAPGALAEDSSKPETAPAPAVVSDAPGGSGDAGPAPAAGDRMAAPHRTTPRRHRARRPAKPSES